MGSLIFDTTFLIDYQREKRKGVGKAHHFFLANQDDVAFTSVISLGEFGEGFGNLTDPHFLSIINTFQILPITPQVASIYAVLSRQLRFSGNPIGSNDLWIAAIAVESGFPLVSNNVAHFSRIPNLQVVNY